MYLLELGLLRPIERVRQRKRLGAGGAAERIRAHTGVGLQCIQALQGRGAVQRQP